jgi:nucleoside-diphosphate-sugar epimerase
VTQRRILVAGGAGFIGSHISDRLIERGDIVVCVDNLSTGQLVNIEQLIGHDRYRFVNHDVCQPLPTDLDEGGFDAVLHLASPASPPAYLALPIETLDVGSMGTRNLLELARQHDARLLLASTSEVYGDPLVHPQPETYWGNVNPIGERSVYDEAKRFAEAITMAYHRTHGVEVRIVRIFNTYGPRLKASDGRAVSNFVAQALRGEPLTVYGDGSQTRSFCYVDDMVAGLLAMLDGPVVGPINIGNPVEYTLLELAQAVLDVSGCEVPLKFGDLPSDDPKVRRPDISLANHHLGWEPSVALVDGLKHTIEWIRANPA